MRGFLGCSSGFPHLDDGRSNSQVFIPIVVGDGFLSDDNGTSEGLRHCGTHNKHETACLEKHGRIFYKQGPTCNDHGGFSLHIFLLPRAFVEFLLPQGHLIRLHVAALGVLGEKQKGMRFQK